MMKGHLYICILLCLLSIPCIGQDLRLPAVPSELRQPKERAAYILEHFWDAMDFSDKEYSLNVPFMEQNMVNFLSLFPHADTLVLPYSVGKLLKRASVDREVLKLVSELTGQYLSEPYSPMWNEEYYIVFLKEYLQLSFLTDVERIRAEYQLKEVLKNRVGTIAVDFRFTDREGRQCTLHKMPGKPMLLVFYSPDCEHCTEILNEIRKLNDVNVLVICADSEYALWNRIKHTLPSEWTVGITSEIERYNIPVFPTLYYLSAQKIIERKTFTVGQESDNSLCYLFRS